MQEEMDLIHQNAENSILYLTALTVLGDRPDQQDSFGFQVGDEEALAVVCDGMGGLKSGKAASQAAANLLLKCYAEAGRLENPAEFLFQCADRANEAVRAEAMEQNCTGQSILNS